MYFTTTPALMSLERTMQQVPNFPPRGGGKYYSKKSYKSKYCNCRLCYYYKKSTGCTQEVCPILNERLECGAATINDAVLAVFGKVKHHPLRKRIERIYMRKESEVMKFRNKMHQAIFEISKSKQHKMSSRAVAVLYLLTADNKLWNCTKHHIDGNGKVNFEKVRVQDLSTDAYALWKTVRELQIGGQEITLGELADAELISDNAFRLIVQAVTVAHYGEIVYSSKYALTELLVCGECKTPYRRCTWTARGQKRVVWRCINRLDYGKKYCHESPTIEETVLQEAIMSAIMKTAK